MEDQIRFAIGWYANGQTTLSIVQALGMHFNGHLSKCKAKSVCLSARKRLRRAVLKVTNNKPYWKDCPFDEIVRVSDTDTVRVAEQLF
jgi:hypothetical protein